jgi:hypothetical protein
MTSTAEYLAAYAAAMQPHCPEPIVAVGAVKAPGAMTTMLQQEIAGKAGRFVGGFLGRQAARGAVAPAPKADGMPDDLLLACTATRIHAFAYKPKSATKVEIRSEYAVWDRDGLVVTADPPGRMTQRLHLRWPNGAEVQLDAVLPPGKSNDLNAPFLLAVGAATADA